jgi:hypothetical protein
VLKESCCGESCCCQRRDHRDSKSRDLERTERALRDGLDVVGFSGITPCPCCRRHVVTSNHGPARMLYLPAQLETFPTVFGDQDGLRVTFRRCTSTETQSACPSATTSPGREPHGDRAEEDIVEKLAVVGFRDPFMPSAGVLRMFTFAPGGSTGTATMISQTAPRKLSMLKHATEGQVTHSP